MPDLPDGTVTLLFTDVENSTQLLRLLGDRYLSLLDEVLCILREAVSSFGGHEVDSHADELFAVFPRAYDAVHAAASAQRLLAAHPWPDAARPRVRMGLHTGEVRLQGPRYSSLAVVHAKRVMEAAHGGQVLLSRDTAEQARDRLGEHLDLLSVGEYGLKDFELQEQLYQLLLDDHSEHFPPPRALGLQTTGLPTPRYAESLPFVNRTTETDLLRARLAGAIRGRGGVVLLAGEPGIGKTRLAEELAAEASGRGFEVTWGRCWENEGAPGFWPWIQILHWLMDRRTPLVLREALGAGGARVADLVPELRERLPGLPPSPQSSDDDARFQLFDTIARFLTRISRSQPLLLLLDDLHWADKSSLLLIQFLLQHLGDARLLVVGTYRDVELDRRHPLKELLPSMRRERGFEALALKGLEEEAIGDLMMSFFEQPLDDRGWALASALRDETDGNPFFLRETLRYLVENEQIVWREGLWTSGASSIAELGLSEAVSELVDRRLSQLSASTTDLLTRAAVIGRDFDTWTVQLVSGAEDEAFDTALDEAEAAGIIEEQPGRPGHYSFKHALFRQALYRKLPRRSRARLHLQIGIALEQRYSGRLAQNLSELAYHFVRGRSAGSWEKAVMYAQGAGNKALATYAYEEAAGQFEAALSVLDQEGLGVSTQRCDLLLALARALSASRGLQRVTDDVAPSALKIAEDLGDHRRAYLACRVAIEALRRFGITASIVTDEFRNWLRRAEQHTKPGTSDRLWVDVWLQYVQGYLGYPGRTWEVRKRNVERAKEANDDALLCPALYAVLASGTPAQWAEQVAYAKTYSDYAWQGVATEDQAVFDVYAAYKLLDAGDRAGWERLHERIRSLAERTRDPFVRFWTLYYEHERLHISGQLDSDLLLQERILSETTQAGMRVFGLSTAVRIGARTRIYLGKAADTLRLIDELYEASGQTRNPHDPGAVLCLAHLGRDADVRRSLEWLLSAEGAIGDRDIVSVVQFLEASVLVGHRESAKALLDLLAPAADAATCRVALTCAARHLAAAAAMLGDCERALRWTEHAVKVSRKIGNRPEIALARLQRAQLIGREAAAVDMRIALEDFRAMKMTPSVERVQILQQRPPLSMNSPTADSSR
jgi:class 3 adenylate cyclase